MAWVDPVGGVDTSLPGDQLNDPDQPFKTLQKAIDTIYTELVDMAGGSVPPGPNPSHLTTTGTAIALPGIYGPQTTGTPHASGDELPIVMRDRVHVRGQGAARCILRGGGDPADYVSVYWPDGQRTYQAKEVLLDLSRTAAVAEAIGSAWPPAWFDEVNLGKDVTEVFDGFTFQGGDIQVLMRSGKAVAGDAPWISRAVVSNCVFDMRDGWTAQGSTIAGPYFGAMLMNRFSEQCESFDKWGYLDTRLLLLHDTFLMAQDGPAGWIHPARGEAVGLINVNDIACNDPSGYYDCDFTLRGIGNPGVVNCVFRTLPGSNQMAMLGIDTADTQVLDQGFPVQTNAFASSRVGVQSPSFPASGFASMPVDAQVTWPYFVGNDCVYGDLADCGGTSTAYFSAAGCVVPPKPPCPPSACSAASLPTPQVEIYDGTSGVGADPAFVGEYLTRTYPSAFAPDYADWRLLPGALSQPHPFQDRGYVPPGNTISMANGTTFALPEHPVAPAPFAWDGEGYGNPRVVDGSPDLGHDELQLLIMAGSYSDNSTSHHQPGFLAPDLPVGGSDRYVIVRRYTPSVSLAVGNLIQINGADETPLNPQVGWTQPPGTLVPATIKQSLPLDYQTKWIRFANASVPTPWEHVIQATSFEDNYKPLGLSTLSQGHWFALFTVSDDEGTEHDYFNTQGVIYDDDSETTDLLRSNLQVEYR